MKGIKGFQKGHTHGFGRIEPNRPTTTKNYGGRIYQDQVEKLSAIADKENKPASQIIRDALDFYFDNYSENDSAT